MFRTALRGAALTAALLPSTAAAAPPAVHSDRAASGSAATARVAQFGPDAPTPSETLPRRWCGDALAADDRAHAYDNGPGRFHAVYFVPADRPSRLAEVGSVFQRDAVAASALIERTRGRAIRLDMGTRCGPQYLDVTTVRLSQTSRELERLAGEPTALYLAAVEALAKVMPAALDGDPRAADNYIGWLDGPAPRKVCGQAAVTSDTRRSEDNRNNFGGKLALIYRDGDDFCGGDVVRHEVAHTLGAVMDRAPNAAPGGHVSDAREDTMAAPSAPQAGSGRAHGEFFDYGSDDYWGELPWWTVDMSRFLCEQADCNVAGKGSVFQTAAAPAAKPAARRRCAARRRAARKSSRRCRILAARRAAS